ARQIGLYRALGEALDRFVSACGRPKRTPRALARFLPSCRRSHRGRPSAEPDALRRAHTLGNLWCVGPCAPIANHAATRRSPATCLPTSGVRGGPARESSTRMNQPPPCASIAIPFDLAVFQATADSVQTSGALNFAPGSRLVSTLKFP